MPEQYMVMVDGDAVLDAPVGRAHAMAIAIGAVSGAGDLEVAVADARTLQVCALWRRSGPGWRVRSLPGWLA